LPGQTGQDGSRSVEPGGDVAEAEQRGPSDGVLAAEPCLLLERTVDGGFELLSVRVVEYTLEDPGRPDTGERYRLITTIMDPEAAPADELAALYAERWEIETALDELKTHQRGPKVVLRSKTSDGVRQEIYGHLCTHYAIRALLSTSAGQDLAPMPAIEALAPP